MGAQITQLISAGLGEGNWRGRENRCRGSVSVAWGGGEGGAWGNPAEKGWGARKWDEDWGSWEQGELHGKGVSVVAEGEPMELDWGATVRGWCPWQMSGLYGRAREWMVPGDNLLWGALPALWANPQTGQPWGTPMRLSMIRALRGLGHRWGDQMMAESGIGGPW